MSQFTPASSEFDSPTGAEGETYEQQWNGGLCAAMEVHESMSNELGQDACDERDFPGMPVLDVFRL